MSATATLDRVDVLRAFKEELRGIDLKSDADFQELVRRAQQLLEMSDQEIGNALGVSRPTVNRWINGKNLPYNAMRRPVLGWIQNQVTARIKKLEGFSRYSASSSGFSGARVATLAAKSRE